MPNPWEMDWGQQTQPAAPAAAAPKMPWEMDWGPSVAGDMAKSAGIGVVKGAIGLLGLPGDAAELGARGIDAATRFVGDKLGVEVPPRAPRPPDYGSADVRRGVETVTGPLYEPHSTAGEYAQTVGEFAPAALAGPGGVARKLVTQAVAPGLASEAAGQATKGTQLEPYARAGAAIATGGVGAALARPATAERALRSQLPEWVTDAHIGDAERLIQDATSRGVNLTWPEALSQVTGRPVLTNAQRITESAAQSRPVMEDFMGARPQQVESAARQEFDRISPTTAQPSTIGPAAAEAATDTITGIRAAINRATKPQYDAAGQTLVPQQVHAAMMADPLFEEALDAVRNNAAKNSFVRGQSDRSVAVYDMVKKELEERAQNAAHPTNPNKSQAVSSATGTLADDVKRIAIASDRNAANGPSSYEAALANQARLRERYLNPVLNGPLGRIADRPETKSAIDALFPAKPLANSEQEISTAVSALSARNPWAARQLVRAHVEQELDQAFNQAGRGQEAAQYAGATWAKAVAGSSVVDGQRLANLRAAVEALPNGQGLWPGFQRLIEIAQATGTRAAKGSLTSFNTRELEKMSTGSTAGNLLKHAGSPGEWWHIVHDAWGRWQLGRNLNQLAAIITNPDSAGLLRQVARMPTNSAQAGAAAARLIAQNAGVVGARGGDEQKNKPRQ